MKFSTSFRGYNKAEVDKYIKESDERCDEVLRTQKERIFSLVDENARLNEELKQYKMDEQAISKSLVESQKLAEELKSDAEKFAQITLERAKIFYATWQSYAKTMLSAMSDDEVRQFSLLARKIEQLMKAYKGDGSVATVAEKEQPSEKPDMNSLPTVETVKTAYQQQGQLVNPIEKVQKAANRKIDLQELLNPTESLESLCAAYGLLDD